MVGIKRVFFNSNPLTEFNSSNTELLNVEQVKEKLLSLQYIRDELTAQNIPF